MSTRLVVSATTQGKMLAEAINHLIIAQNLVHRLTANVGRMTYGAPADYASMAAEFGSISAAQAADLASLLTLADTALQIAILSEFASRCDQG